MTTVKNNNGTKRVRAVAKSKRPPNIYFALHSTQLARCLAHGLLFAPTRSALRPRLAPVPAEILEEARHGLGYGNVVLVEFEPARLGLGNAEDTREADITGYREVPLAWVNRVVFRSNYEREEFAARASAYEDVPVDAVEYAVDAALFGASSLLGEAPAPSNVEPMDEAAVQLSTAIDKVSGVISSVLAGLRWGNATSKQVDGLHAACVATEIESSAASLVRELAGSIDTAAGSDFGNRLVGIASRILSAPGTGNGFDADAFLAELCRLGITGSLDSEMVAKFGARAAAVLSGATELRDDAFTDAGGKVALRALLLFMLNPEVEALHKIRGRLDNIGEGVFSLGCALAGCYAGIARLGVSTKAPEKAVFLGTTLLAWRICLGQPLAVEKRSAWTRVGSHEIMLAIENLTLASTALPVQEHLLKLKIALESMGIDPEFDCDTGALSWRSGGAGGAEFFAFTSSSPTLPRVDAIDICIHVEQKALAKGGARAAADASLAARESGVFARQSTRGKNKGVEFRVCCIAEMIYPAIIDAASDALQAQANTYQDKLSDPGRLVALRIGAGASGAAALTAG